MFRTLDQNVRIFDRQTEAVNGTKLSGRRNWRITTPHLLGSTVAALALLWSAPALAQDQAEEDKAEETSENGSPIVVTATRTEKLLLKTPAAVTVQNLDELRELGFTYGTDEFRGVPGVFFRRGEGDGDEYPFVTIRGVTGNHGNDTFLALIDGIPFVGPDEEVLLTEVPYGSVENVEIVRGPVSALYGRGAIAGAVNYITRTPSGSGGRIEVTGGSDDYYRVAAGVEGTSGDFAFLVDGAYENYEGWRANSARETVNLFAKGVWSPTDTTTLTAYLSYINRDAEVPSTIPTLADGTIVKVTGGRKSFLGLPPTKNDTEGFIAALRLEHDFTDDLSIQITGHARNFDSDVRLNFYDTFGFNPSRNVMAINGFASKTDASVYVGEVLLNWRSGAHTIVAGISGERATMQEEDRWTGQFGFTPQCGFAFYLVEIDYTTGAVLNRNNPCFVTDQLRTQANTTNTFWSAFVQDEIALTSNLTLTLGARYDAFDRKVDFDVLGTLPTNAVAKGNEGAISPKASLAYDYGPGLFYASYGRGFNSNFGPVFQWDTSRYARVERPTTIDSFEIGWKGAAWDGRFEWEGALFYLQQRNRRLFVSNPDQTGPSTLATTGQKFSSRGVEASVRLYPSDRTKITVNYTYLDPEWDELILTSFGGKVDLTGTDPRGVADHIVYVELSQEITDWLTAKASYEYYSDYQITQANNVPGRGAFDLVNLSATARLPKRDDLSLSVSVLNLFDNEYYYYLGGKREAVTNVTPGPPRQFRVTLRTTF